MLGEGLRVWTARRSTWIKQRQASQHSLFRVRERPPACYVGSALFFTKLYQPVAPRYLWSEPKTVMPRHSMCLFYFLLESQDLPRRPLAMKKVKSLPVSLEFVHAVF